MSVAQLQTRRAPAPSLSMPADQLRLLGMNTQVWQRNASPLSVYSRMATLPVLLLTIWSHVWIGPVPAFLATLAVIVWLRLNPRLFAAPRNMTSWASRATLGERVWLNQRLVPIPPEDAQRALVLSVATGIGFIVALVGAYQTNLWLAVTGAIVTYAAKLVFLDRMVSLYDRMRDAHPLYRFWTETPDNDNSR